MNSPKPLPTSPKDTQLILNKYKAQQNKIRSWPLIEHDNAKQSYKKERAEARKRKYSYE